MYRSLKTRKKKSNKHKKTQKKQTVSKLNIKPKQNPNDFELNKFKSNKKNLFRVSMRKNKKIWRIATKKERKCYKYLQSKISYNLDEYKKGKYKTSKQAIAIAYNQAKNKYPDCKL